MLGGGFLGQAHQTSKENRELLKSVLRRPEQSRFYNKNESTVSSLNSGVVTEQEKSYWKTVVEQGQRREQQKKLIIFLTSVVITVIVVFVLYVELGLRLKRFWLSE
jgi:hypothetical protein